jgi:hypothetical protein
VQTIHNLDSAILHPCFPVRRRQRIGSVRKTAG